MWALVAVLHRELNLPVYGLCNYNPHGFSILSMYHCAGDRTGVDGRYKHGVLMHWIGLRPSEVDRMKGNLPGMVFQKLTDLDNKRIASLLDVDKSFLTAEDEDEVQDAWRGRGTRWSLRLCTGWDWLHGKLGRSDARK
ncbi:hypothetical protein ACHAWF_000819 [Thalassiosira exigua]